MISRVGDDDKGERIIDYLKKEGVNTETIQIDKEYPTSEVLVSLDESGNASYEIPEPGAWDVIALTNDLKNRVAQSDLFVFGSLSSRNAVTRETLKTLLQTDVFKVFDVNLREPFYNKELLLDLLDYTDFAKFNDDELYKIADYLECPYRGMEQCIAYIASAKKLQTVCVTKGPFGAVLYNSGNFYYNSGYRIKVVDTVGSGDSFLASVLFKIFSGESYQEAINFACAVGAMVATREGANPQLSEQEIQEFMHPKAD
ncbi:MAG: PfkB family carbohydrate kinase [Leeuwenhoekiella sp.]